MKCARVHLQQRSKGKIKTDSSTADKPRRYCQKRLVNPDHEEDPRWIDIFDRFHCNMDCDQLADALDSVRAPQETEEMVLTVQTLKFEGDVDQTTRPRTSFKYKKTTDGNKHRMFVKQAVQDKDFSDDGRSSQLTYCYIDDYLKYLYNSDRSRPTSGKSSIFLRGLSKDKPKENKATQVEITNTSDLKKTRKVEPKIKNSPKKNLELKMKEEIKDIAETIENTKITYQKAGKRKSLTISRTQSPETVQVIRVDVVCNNSCTPTSDYEDKKVEGSTDSSEPNVENIISKHNYFANKYTNHFANKYLLTNTIKSLDENLSGGAKVTLLCKTFKLSDRTRSDKNIEKETKSSRTLKRSTRKDNKMKRAININVY